MLIAVGAIFVILALLSLSASEGAEGRQKALNTLLGAAAVGAVVLVLARAGLGWAGMVVALLWAASRRYRDVWRRRSAPPSPESPPHVARPGEKGRMTREEAFAVLGLSTGASKDQILLEYRRLMKKVHPDQGGTTYLAARLNEAKDVLLSG